MQTRWQRNALEGGTDLYYSRLVADTFGLELKVKIFDIEAAKKSIPEVVRALDTCNPMLIRFGVAMYAALSYAKIDKFNRYWAFIAANTPPQTL
ncbi:MAG: asparagine synthase-related protein [Candidatus Methanospirareceae archaeon]